MRLNDRVADAKSHAGAVRLRSKERIEYLVDLLGGQPYASIADGHHKFFIFSSLRPDREFARPSHIVQRIDAVHGSSRPAATARDHP
jgi:hypothetical protein